MSISDCGWSTFTSMGGGNQNLPLSAAFCCSCLANSRISLSSAVEAMTNSTGKVPPPGSAGGSTANASIPGMAEIRCWISGSTCAVVRFRWLQGLSPTPQNPLLGVVSWKVNFDSGISITVLCTSAVETSSWSSVELEGVLMMPKRKPWSSAGASSFFAI